MAPRDGTRSLLRGFFLMRAFVVAWGARRTMGNFIAGGDNTSGTESGGMLRNKLLADIVHQAWRGDGKADSAA